MSDPDRVLSKKETVAMRFVVLSMWVFLATGVVNVLRPDLSLLERVAATMLLVGLRSVR